MVRQKSVVEKALERIEFVLVAEDGLEDVSSRTLSTLLNQGLARRFVEITDSGRNHLRQVRGETVPKAPAKKARKAAGAKRSA